ncbi:SRPBCC family protein [Nesterenkonia lutea]
MVAYSAEISAPAEELFVLVSDPHRHHELDGSGTVQPRAIGPRQLQTGDRFSVHMRLFGVPYRLPLRVLTSQPPSAQRPGVLEWVQPTGHRWRWEMTSLTGRPGHTLVTETYDARRQLRPVRGLLRLLKVCPRNAASIRGSLRRLQERCEQPSREEVIPAGDRTPGPGHVRG